MEKVYIIYWTQTGNTLDMANAIAVGVNNAGKEAVLQTPTEASIDELADLPGFALGCPAMGNEVLEEDEMEPFVCEVEAIANGKTIALFGSYGWGDGEWMREWVLRMQSAGATIINDEGIISNGEATDEERAALIEVGSILAGM